LVQQPPSEVGNYGARRGLFGAPAGRDRLGCPAGSLLRKARYLRGTYLGSLSRPKNISCPPTAILSQQVVVEFPLRDSCIRHSSIRPPRHRPPRAELHVAAAKKSLKKARLLGRADSRAFYYISGVDGIPRQNHRGRCAPLSRNSHHTPGNAPGGPGGGGWLARANMGGERIPSADVTNTAAF
jgi:hypothetical protein